MKIRERRICSLAYADDVVVLEMESMIRRLEGEEATRKCGKDENNEIQKRR